MAAKLEWKVGHLMMGPFRMGRVAKATPNGKLYVYAVGRGVDSEPYESLVDCMQDGEAETRRQLREVGVEVEP